MPGTTQQNGFVIATSPRRTVRRARNQVQKFATVRPGGKFQWVTDQNQATVFPTMSALLKAFGLRCQELRGEPTSDLIVHQVQAAGIRTVGVLNGN